MPPWGRGEEIRARGKKCLALIFNTEDLGKFSIIKEEFFFSSFAFFITSISI